MKNTLIILVFLFVLPMTAQRQKATIYFKDGKALKGLIKLDRNGDMIKFRLDKKSSKEKISCESIKKLIVHKKKNNIEYR